jgi:hypothetical protein
VTLSFAGTSRPSNPRPKRRAKDSFAWRDDVRDFGQFGFSRPSSRAISASSDSTSAIGSSTLGGALTLDTAFAFCAGARISPACCAPSDAGAEGCGLAAGCEWPEAVFAAGTVPGGGAPRASAFAAPTTESALSEGGDDVAGLPGADKGFGEGFSVRRVTVVLFAEPPAGAIGGGIAGRCG